MTTKRKYEKPTLRSHGQLNTFIHGNSPTATGFDNFSLIGPANDGTGRFVVACEGMGQVPVPSVFICQ